MPTIIEDLDPTGEKLRKETDQVEREWLNSLIALLQEKTTDALTLIPLSNDGYAIKRRIPLPGIWRFIPMYSWVMGIPTGFSKDKEISINCWDKELYPVIKEFCDRKENGLLAKDITMNIYFKKPDPDTKEPPHTGSTVPSSKFGSACGG